MLSSWKFTKRFFFPRKILRDSDVLQPACINSPEPIVTHLEDSRGWCWTQTLLKIKLHKLTITETTLRAKVRDDQNSSPPIIHYIFESSVGLRLSPLWRQCGVWQCTVCNSATYRSTRHTIVPCCACFQVCVQGQHAGSSERTVVGGPTPQKSDNSANHSFFFFFLHPGSLPPDPIVTRLPLLTTYHTRLYMDPHWTDEAPSLASNCLMSKRLHWISNPVFQTPKSGPFG